MDGTDAQVIGRSITDPSSFGTLFDRHAAVLLRFLVRRVGPETADALLGETFRIAFERRATFDAGRVTARPWLYGIATNLIARNRRTGPPAQGDGRAGFAGGCPDRRRRSV